MAQPESVEPSPAEPARAEAPLSRNALWSYTLPGFGVSFLYTLVLVAYLNFATDHLGAAPAVVGLIFAAAKVWDAFADPTAGYLSDRTRSRFGRRRSWMLASSLPLAVFAWLAWAPPASLHGLALSAWIAVTILGFHAAYSVFEVPNLALGAELTQDRVARQRVFGLRQAVRTIALFGAFGIGYPIVLSGREGAAAVGLVMGLVSAALIVVCTLRLPPERADYQARGGQRLWRSFADVWSNPHARLLLIVYFIESIGIGGLSVLVPYVTRYVMERPDLGPTMLVTYTTANLAGIPLWLWLGRRYEKRRLWLVAMLQGGFGFGILFFLGPNDWPLMVASSLIAGSANACAVTLGQALKADLVDVDEHRTGERKEGAYFAAWSFVGKLANGIMIAVVGVVLSLVGYQPNVPQSERVLFAMVFLLGGMPTLGYAIGSLLFSRFSLSEAEHARIRAELDARAAARTA
jgi:GPH family glycoside/pentoside/hexuronide:cation symporter